MTTLTALIHLRERLRQKTAVFTADPFADHLYTIPGRWLGIERAATAVSITNPYQLWLEQVEAILAQPATPVCGQQIDDWSREAIVYNLFVRNATAFDHDGDGLLGKPNPAGFQESGTFTKSLLLLPYIRDLGCNTIHLLPITAVGQQQRKGIDGSPYAIRNQYALDENLAEPSLGLGAEAEFAAFVEAAHHLGLRVVMEFIFRTASRDADWVQAHPHWFYWIDTAVSDRPPHSQDESLFGMPIFSEAEQQQLLAQIQQRPFTNLLPPSATYQALYLPPPRPEDVVEVNDEQGRWLAHYPDGRNGRIPGAFSDWPIDNQPPWPDVTYLRLYDHPDFNYMAYNTLRCYDERLAQPEHRLDDLWQQIIGIIPHYQQQFGIDGAMIDMGHALPRLLIEKIIAAARRVDPTFAFWKEEFTLNADSREEGYNVVLGNLLAQLADTAVLRPFLRHLASNGIPIPFFGAPESHNSRRAAARPGGAAYVRYAAALALFLPTVPFVHNGVEFGETHPVNTGGGFTAEEYGRLPPTQLPLFTTIPFTWTQEPDNLTHYWQKILHLHQQYQPLLRRETAVSLHLLASQENEQIQAILRLDEQQQLALALIVNHDCHQSQTGFIQLPSTATTIQDQIGGGWVDLQRPLTLQPGQALWLDLCQ